MNRPPKKKRRNRSLVRVIDSVERMPTYENLPAHWEQFIRELYRDPLLLEVVYLGFCLVRIGINFEWPEKPYTYDLLRPARETFHDYLHVAFLGPTLSASSRLSNERLGKIGRWMEEYHDSQLQEN